MDKTKNQDVGWSVTSYKDHYPTAGAKASAEMPQTRRILSEMAKDSRRRGLLSPNDTSAGHHPFIRNRRSGPSNGKRTFFHFHIPTSHDKIIEKHAANSF
jgi:hypothetical protein